VSTPPEPNELATALERALAAAGRDLTAAFADAGLRTVASMALGQVIGGNRESARGMVDALPMPSRYMLAEALGTLEEMIADTLPETHAADRDQAEDNREYGEAINLSGPFIYALRGRNGDMHRRLDAEPVDALYRLRAAAQLIMREVDARLPQDGSGL
jgi:hypothetical protein